MSTAALHLGIDIGTQGARAVAITADGSVVARGSSPLVVPDAGPVQEQRPSDWWDALVIAVGALGAVRERVVSVAVSCTSGSVCAVDGSGTAIGPGLLYADHRAVPFDGADASWAVAKIAWLVTEGAVIIEGATTFTSPGGYVTGRLLAGPAPIDVTQALKFGFDPEADRWGRSPVEVDQLPTVVPTGMPIGTVAGPVAADLGLRPGVVVVAGATDGIAGHLACGPTPGRWATAIGSTIVWKAMASTRIDVPGHGIYSHRGPDDRWFPGAASNAGARILSTWADAGQLAAFGDGVTVTPATVPAWPGVVTGERFPFADPGFVPWPAPDRVGPGRYASEVSGIALVERWGCEVLVSHGCAEPESIATTGGVVSSDRFTQLRADVQQVPIEVPAEPSSAFGAALIAASPDHGGVLAACEAMVRIDRCFEPDDREAARWDDAFGRFVERCARRREGAA